MSQAVFECDIVRLWRDELGRKLMADRSDKLTKITFKTDEPDITLSVRATEKEGPTDSCISGESAGNPSTIPPCESETCSDSQVEIGTEGLRTPEAKSEKQASNSGANSESPQISSTDQDVRNVTDSPSLERERTLSPSPERETLSDLARNNNSTPIPIGLKVMSRSNTGLSRHKLVIVGCIGLVAAVFTLSTLDLKGLTGTEATINSSLKVEYKKSKPDLSPNMIYDDAERNSNFPYTNELPSDNGLLRVSESNWGGDAIGFVDSSGKIVIKPQFESAGNFHEGLAEAKPKGRNDGLRGYIDSTGTWAIPPTYNDAGPFHSGIAPISTSKYSGFIDRAGHVTKISAPNLPTRVDFRGHAYKYESGNLSIPVFIGKNYVVSAYGGQGIVDKTGKWLLPPQYTLASFSNLGLAMENFNNTIITNKLRYGVADKYFKISGNSKEGVVDSDGNILIEPTYEGISSFSNGCAAVRVSGDFGFVDTRGNFVIEPKYDDVTPFGELIGVKENGRWHLIDSKGRTIESPDIDGVLYDHSQQWFQNGLGPVVRNGLCGYVNNKGQLVVPCKFNFVMPFSNGIAPVWDGQNWQYIDTTGKFVSPMKFAKISQFIDGLSQVMLPGPLTALSEAQSISTANGEFKNLVEQVLPRSPAVNDNSVRE